MTLSLTDIAGTNFRTDYDSDELNTRFMRRLGMSVRYLPARLAISRSLAMDTPVDLPVAGLDPGKVIKGETLFGTGTALSVWIALIVERAGAPDIDIKMLMALVGAHWRRGLARLDADWTQSGGDIAQFVRRIIEAADLPGAGLSAAGGADAAGVTASTGKITVAMGTSGEDVAPA